MKTIVIVLVLCASGAAFGQDEDWKGPYVGVSGVYAIGSFSDTAVFDFSDGGGFGLKAGTRLNEYLAVEVGFEWAGGFEDNVAGIDVDARLWNLTARGKVYPWLGPVQPYLLAGIGVEGIEIEATLLGITDSASDTGFAVRVGGGLDVLLGSHWLATFEVAYMLTDAEIVSLGVKLADAGYLSLGLGLVYRF